MVENSPDFATHKKIWETNARQNAKWAVISDPKKAHTDWDDGEFFTSGSKDVELVLSNLTRLCHQGYAKESALDFGCGVGRLCRALSNHYASVIGIDISEPMIEKARAMNSDRSNCEFLANPRPDLSVLTGRKFDLVLSLIVIQHIPPPYSEAYLRDLFQLLAPHGVLVVQIPSQRISSIKNVVRSLIPERMFRLKHAWLKPQTPYITMYGIPETRVRELANRSEVRFLEAQENGLAGDDWKSLTYYFRKGIS